MKYSFRKQLEVIGEDSKPVFYRGFSCVHRSLLQTLEAMSSPMLHKWFKTSEYKNSSFLESCQGVTHDGRYWYFTANGNNGRQGVFKYDQSMKKVGGLKLTGNTDLLSVRNIPTVKIPIREQLIPVIGHVGDLDCYDGKIYIPVQNPHGFLVMDTSLHSDSISWHPTEKIGDSHPWCAVNPWNDRLYTSKFNGTDDFEQKTTLYAYDRKTFKREKRDDIPLKVPTHRVQGGCFSNDGKLFLTSDAKGYTLAATNHPKFHEIKNSGASLKPSITCYSVINGHYFGAIGIKRDSSLLFKQEVEGIAYWAKKENNKDTHLHLVLLENKLGTDEVFFKHFADSN